LETLVSALVERGYQIEFSKNDYKNVYLSLLTPDELGSDESRDVIWELARTVSRIGAPRVTYPTIVAEYIRSVEPFLSSTSRTLSQDRRTHALLGRGILHTFDDRALEYLARRGYSVEDVMSWAWVLTAENPFVSVMRYIELEKHNGRSQQVPKSIPPFLFLFILRHKDIPMDTLPLLLDIANRMLQSAPQTLQMARQEIREESAGVSPWVQLGDYKTPMILLVRLLRLARALAPPVFLPIVGMFTSTFTSTSGAGKSDEAKDDYYRILTELYNTFISLLSMPCRISPYRAAAVQHQAAFRLLEEMAKFDPPLVVTRRGYEGLIRIEAARGKTSPEKEWGMLKSQSWPPWKADRLGTDANRGKEGRYSLAMRVIHHMQKAGYALGSWERVAGIVAGWDTDGTPTIQTRTLLPVPRQFQVDIELNPNIWAARIRATRTKREAWACFLAYKRLSLPIDEGVYLEMIEKLGYGERLVELPSSTNPPFNAPIPGDGKELFAEPSSPWDVVHLQTEPPSLNEFLRTAFAQGIKVTQPLLRLVLKVTDSFDLGMECIGRSFLTLYQIDALRHTGPTFDQKRLVKRLAHLHQVPDDVFHAYIKFLCRCDRGPTPRAQPRLRETFPIAFASAPDNLYRGPTKSYIRPEQALVHTTLLMRMRMPKAPQPWNSFLSYLLRYRTGADHNLFAPAVQRVIAWREALEVFQWMNGSHITLDLEGLKVLCTAFLRLLQSVSQDIDATEEQLNKIQQQNGYPPSILSDHPHLTLPETMQLGLDLLTRQFYLLTCPNADSGTRLFHPTAHQLLAFTRVLGLAGDYDGLLSLLKWMSQAEDSLTLGMDGSVGEGVRLRAVVVAVRTLLETGLSPERAAQDGTYADARIQAAYDIVQQSKLLSPWPEAEEMDLYADEIPAPLKRGTVQRLFCRDKVEI
jgi:hypothetical protein